MPDMPAVFVTGATGFVGKHLTHALCSAGNLVHILTRSQADTVLGVTAHRYDGSTESVFRAIESARPRVVFHLAACFRSEHTPDDVAELVAANLLLGTQIVDAMSRLGCLALVNTGTSWQNFHDQEYSPVNLYAASKQAFEDLLQYYVEAHGLRVITLRLFDTYGPGDRRKKLLRLLREAARTEQPLLLSPGEQQLDLLHVDDVVQAFLQAAERLAETTGHERYLLSSGRRVRLRDLVTLVEQALGKSIPVQWAAREYRAREVMKPPAGTPLPGWSPRITLEDGLRQTFAKDEAS